MSKTPSQQKKTAQVKERLTTESAKGHVRVSGSAKRTGGKRGSTASLDEIHPSLADATTALVDAGLESGTITTSSGLSVPVTKGPRAASHEPHGQGMAPQRGKEPLPQVQEGVSQRFEQRIGADHGPEKVEQLKSEVDAIARRPNPLRSDGLVDGVVALHAPSMGGNSYGRGGQVSARAKRGDANIGPGLITQQRALSSIGYGTDVQDVILKDARDRIARTQGRAGFAALTEAEQSARAYGQVNEHLDEALHGTKNVGHEESIIRDAVANSDVPTAAPSSKPATAASEDKNVVENDTSASATDSPAAPRRAASTPGLGMTLKRTPNQQAQRRAVKDLVRGGKWNGLRDADAMKEAQKNDLDLLTAKQKLRRATSIAPEERNTMSAGAAPEQKARRNAQPVFSTGPAAPFAASGPVGVGVASEPKAKVLPARPRAGAISPIPTRLPTEPARLGRTREERGVRASSWPTAEQLAAPITAPVKGSSKPAPRRAKSPVPAPASNVEVAQTATPVEKTKTIAEKRAAQRAQL